MKTNRNVGGLSARILALCAAFMYWADVALAADFSPSNWKYVNPLEGTVNSITDFGTKLAQALLGLAGPIALLFLIVAGISYVTSAGSEEKIKSSKRIISGTIIGLGIALVAFSLLQTILRMLNGA